jgi:hypothetical protein
LGESGGDGIPAGGDLAGEGESEIRSEISAAASKAGLHVLSIDILHADQPAPAVVVETDNPAQAVADASQITATLFGGNPPTYEGYYLEVKDAQYAVVFLRSPDFRSGAGRSETNSAYEGHGTSRTLKLGH